MGWYKVINSKYPLQTKNLYQFKGIGALLRRYKFKKVHTSYNQISYYKTLSQVLNRKPSKIYKY